MMLSNNNIDENEKNDHDNDNDYDNNEESKQEQLFVTIKFVPFSSTVDSPFWVRYCHLKLETIQLKEDPITIIGSYGVATTTTSTSSSNNSSSNRLQCQESSFLLDNSNSSNNNNAENDMISNIQQVIILSNDRVGYPGILIGYNTKEAFQKVDKNKLLKDLFCKEFFDSNGDATTPPGSANAGNCNVPSFVLITFADLKQHKVLYWFGFPALMTKNPIMATIITTRTTTTTTNQEVEEEEDKESWWTALGEGLYDYRIEQKHLPAYFAVPAELLKKKKKMKIGEEIETEVEIEEEESSSSTTIVVPKLKVVAPLNRNYRHDLNLQPQQPQPQPQQQQHNKNNDNTVNDVVFGFVDPTSSSGSGSGSSRTATDILMMGWPMRNLIAYLVLHLGLEGKIVTIVSLRHGRCPNLRGRIETDIDIEDSNSTNTQATTKNISQVDTDNLIQDSILMKIKLPLRDDYDYSNNNDDVDKTASTVVTTSAPPAPVPPHYKVVGWELNIRQKPGPRWVNLRPLLDKNHLAIQAADLNLKLMKWRMIPDLDVDTLQNSTKVLLLGAGTLGCSVSRTLLGWGIRNFKFVDYGNVSYSNPVRQVLFNLKDCHYGNSQGKPKAQAAADALQKIAPDVISEGIQLCIPMPGHAYDENNTTSTLNKTVQQLDQLIQDSDVIFLLTDTRESRWLPTVMAAVHDKILINAALGLDSWLVMRHGCGDNDIKDHNHSQNQQENNDGSSETSPSPASSSSSSSNRLGCYFCNDVVAPENSTRNRTLDQQCTVTRPGLAPIASSMAVELFVSLLHHPQRQRAPAPPVQKNNGSSNNSATYSPTDNSSNSSSSPLGVIPHQIRGSIVTYTMMTPSVPAFVYCTGCSSAILDEYRKDKFELVSRTCSSIDGSSHLENLSGLTQFRAEAAEKIAEMENDYWDDEDDDNEF